ncbi:MAG: bifunctional 4-hydroxy-2-oxoglutarate aldolase/2-dehydro-3-deoxy-phosphogluconate aldolase, partial [Clostridia bacterium]|nr:bifunctional 4-hydroxy-2-oxoglutarate aldolase/2-dehydro-3-deoxy-phosphogluconate aldolase [Clostridia bacterium]
FIISPDTCESVIKKTVELGLVSIPGALTPTEVETAHRYGADFVKVFPVNFMGPSYIKALKAPLSHIRLLAVGGIDENNMKDYMSAGACGFGVATGIVNKTAIADGDFDAVTRLALKYTERL